MGTPRAGGDLYLLSGGVPGVHTAGAGVIETIGVSVIGESRTKALEMSWALSDGVSVLGAVVKDATSYSRVMSGTNNDCHAAEHVGLVAVVSLTVEWSASRNTIVESGGEIGTAELDVIM